TKAAGLDNAGSKWSREAQTKFVPRGLRQGSIINESQKHCKKKRDLIMPSEEEEDEVKCSLRPKDELC
ncbi:MAG: hypothetical protein IKJ23_05350, partial [Bacteroidaceae bacterium]|nr:hypothetical protein [Bacteroidaceae bacterium]